MPNYNTQLQSNNADLQEVLQVLQNKAAGGGEQATPVISVNSANGLITATAGVKSSTHQLAFQPAKTITPSATSQIAISSGYYTGGNITINPIPSQYVIPNGILNITTNGIHDVKNYASAIVSISGSVSNEIVEYSENEDAIINKSISGIYINDRIKSIGVYTFYECSNLTSVNFPACTRIGNRAFYYCKGLTFVNFPVCTSIGNEVFVYCTSLTSASFPACTRIGDKAFYNCFKLTSANFPACTSIGDYAFYCCSSLTSVSFPVCTNIGSYAFRDCSRLTSVNFPICTSIGNEAFRYCKSLTTVNFPVCTSIGSNAFGSCCLTSVNFPACTTISDWAFNDCYSLSSLTLGASTVCTLGHSNAFTETPYAGYSSYFSGTPYIYVPASLVDAYKNATNWTYFSSYFSSIESLEGGDNGDDPSPGESNLITFTIAGTEYQAEEGMTWAEWINSVYNKNYFIIGSDGIMTDAGGIIQYNNINVKSTDLIVSNYIYSIFIFGGGQ